MLSQNGGAYSAVATGGSSAITSLTGPVTGTGPGATATTITPTGVSAGSYTKTNLTVNAAGQITSASNGTGSALFSKTFNTSNCSPTCTWTAPLTVTSIQAFGRGGAGGGASGGGGGGGSTSAGATGGGGGAPGGSALSFQIPITVVGGMTYTITIGTGGTAGTLAAGAIANAAGSTGTAGNPGGNGGSTSFDSLATWVGASGGSGGGAGKISGAGAKGSVGQGIFALFGDLPGNGGVANANGGTATNSYASSSGSSPFGIFGGLGIGGAAWGTPTTSGGGGGGGGGPNSGDGTQTPESETRAAQVVRVERPVLWADLLQPILLPVVQVLAERVEVEVAAAAHSTTGTAGGSSSAGTAGSDGQLVLQWIQ